MIIAFSQGRMYPREDQPEASQPSTPSRGEEGDADCARNPACRLNLLLSYSGWHPTNCIEQLPRLLSPMGIHSYVVSSGDEAAELIQHHPIHIAVVDLGIPLQRRPHPPHHGQVVPHGQAASGGARILQLLRRLDQPPPTVVIRPSQPSIRESQRTLREALREGAFAVLDAPLRMETMLETMRRVLRRHYADNWPRN